MKYILKWLSLSILIAVFCIGLASEIAKSEQILLEPELVNFNQRPDYPPNQSIFSPDFKVYVKDNVVINHPYEGFEEKTLPTVNVFTGSPGCYIACYSGNQKNSIYSVGGNINVMGQIRVAGFYKERICLPKGFENADISAESSFKELCAKNLPNACQGDSCWTGGDTGGWFGLQDSNAEKDTKTKEAETLKDRGWEQLKKGEPKNSLQSYEKAHSIYQEIEKKYDEPWGDVGALGGIGNAYAYMGNYHEAIKNYEKYLDIAYRRYNLSGQAYASQSLGNMYTYVGDYSEAEKFYQASLKIAKQLQDEIGEGYALAGIGNIFNYTEKYEQAIEYHQDSLNIKKNNGDVRGEVATLINLGDDYYKLGNYAEAIKNITSSLKINQKIKNERVEAIALNNLGNAYEKQREYSKAIKFYQQSFKLNKKIDYIEGQSYALNGLGVALFKSGNFVEAEKQIRNAIELRESIRSKLGDSDALKVSFGDIVINLNAYRNLQQVLIAQKKINPALEIAEKGRSRALVELLAQALSPPTNKATISSLNIEQIKQIAKTQNATLVEYSIIYDDFNVKGKLQGKESKLYIWVIKPTGEISFRAVELKPLWQKPNTSLKDLVADVRCFNNVNCIKTTQIAQRSARIFNQPAQDKQARPIPTPQYRNQKLKQLHQLLIQPIAHLLPSNPDAHVIFMPQGELFLVPFPALIDAKNQYLIKKHTILTAPSIQTLDLTRQQRQRIGQIGLQNSVVVGIPRGNAVVVGNPTMPSVGEPAKQLPSLQGAEDEANDIAHLIKTQALTGAKATKAAVTDQMRNAKIIHLATHGILDEYRGLGSAIALAPTADDNGLLTAEDILKLNLNAELVVLSACNTGGGRITGDGVIGLSRSFISAGVPSIIVSLWSIPDAPTGSLMTKFYNNWQQDPNKDKAKALRQAMLATMKKSESRAPENWAAFTLIGEAQ